MLRAAGAGLAGGHSGEGAETALGFAVTGAADPARLLRKGGLRPGDRLVLTKPLGTGVILAAAMRGAGAGGLAGRRGRGMQQPGGPVVAALAAHGATACTDVTGFGLLGHLVEMLRAGGCAASLDPAAMPAAGRRAWRPWRWASAARCTTATRRRSPACWTAPTWPRRPLPRCSTRRPPGGLPGGGAGGGRAGWLGRAAPPRLRRRADRDGGARATPHPPCAGGRGADRRKLRPGFPVKRMVQGVRDADQDRARQPGAGKPLPARGR